VDVIITDSPLLLSIIYDKSKNKIFKELVKEQFNNFDNLNYYVRRNSIYNPKGRLETIDEAVDKDVEILELLDDNHISYRSVDKIDAVDRIFNDVSHILNI
jgi:hypothetical protein